MWPAAVPFDPMAGSASPAVAALLGAPELSAPVLLLAAGPLAQRSGWAARAAIAIAEAFAGRGERVVLADLSLDRPELHELLAVDNEEGLSDVFLFGASLQHVARSVNGKPFRLIPAAPFTADAGEVVRHARWHAVFDELAARDEKLLVYMPVDVDGAKQFAEHARSTIVLADANELDEIKKVMDVEHVAAIATPPAVSPSPSPSPSPSRSDEEFERIRIPKDAARDALIADLRARQRAALMAAPPAMSPLPHDESATRTFHATPRDPNAPPPAVFKIAAVHPLPAKPRRWFSWVIALVLVAAAAGGLWYSKESGWLKLGRGNATRSDPPLPVSHTPPLSRAAAAAPLPYSVAVASYQTLNAANDRASELADENDALAFFVAPIVVQGTLFYRVMAGPVQDSSAAAALRDTLIARRVKTISLAGDVVAAPFAFLLGEHASRDAAQAQSEDAAKKGIPSYIVAMDANGGTQFRVYAGAYTGLGDAEFMRPILRAAGLPDNLVERTGSIHT